MSLVIDRGGGFTLSIESEQLSKGLRPSKRLQRDSNFLTVCNGAVGRDGVLCTIDQLTRMVTDVIVDGFPYPQVFVLTSMIIVCGLTKIYELVEGVLIEKLTVTAGNTWSLVDFNDYVYMSNGMVAVTRSAADKTYSLSTTLPVANAICNNNGQIIIGGLTT